MIFMRRVSGQVPAVCPIGQAACPFSWHRSAACPCPPRSPHLAPGSRAGRSGQHVSWNGPCAPSALAGSRPAPQPAQLGHDLLRKRDRASTGTGLRVVINQPSIVRLCGRYPPLRLGQVAGRSWRHARSARTPHKPSAREQPAGQLIASGPAHQADTVKAGLTSKRPRCRVENDEYAAFVRRILRAYSCRVGDGDVEALAVMLGLAEEIDTAIAEAVKGLRACGYS